MRIEVPEENMKVKEIMSHPVRTCSESDTLDRAARLMWEHNVGAIVVEADGRVRGLITDRDISLAGRFTGRPLWTIPVSEVMSVNVEVVRSHDSVDIAERLMRTRQIRRLPVVDDSWKLVGFLSLDDLARESRQRHGRRRAAVGADHVGATLAAICERYGASSPPILPF